MLCVIWLPWEGDCWHERLTQTSDANERRERATLLPIRCWQSVSFHSCCFAAVAADGSSAVVVVAGVKRIERSGMLLLMLMIRNWTDHCGWLIDTDKIARRDPDPFSLVPLLMLMLLLLINPLLLLLLLLYCYRCCWCYWSWTMTDRLTLIDRRRWCWSVLCWCQSQQSEKNRSSAPLKNNRVGHALTTL